MAYLLKLSLEEENEFGTSRRVISELSGDYFGMTWEELLPYIEDFLHAMSYEIDGKELKLVDKRK